MNKGECTNPEIGKLLHAYELNSLNEEQNDRFEAHLIGCDYCYHEVIQFSNRAEIIIETLSTACFIEGRKNFLTALSTPPRYDASPMNSIAGRTVYDSLTASLLVSSEKPGATKRTMP